MPVCVCVHMYTQSCTCTWWALENLFFCSKHYIICNILCITCPLCLRHCAEGGQGNTFLAPKDLKCSRFMFSVLAFCIKLFVCNNSILYLDVHIHLNSSYRNGFSSVQSCPTLCDPCSTPRLPVHHQLPEFTQIRVHWVGDAIQPSHPLLPPSPPAFNLSQHQDFFIWISSSHQVAKVLVFQLQHQSFQWIFRVDFL